MGSTILVRDSGCNVTGSALNSEWTTVRLVGNDDAMCAQSKVSLAT